MFLIWGTKHRAEDAGVVADWCDTCGVVQPQQLTDHYQVSHLYYIPLGGGTLKGTSRRCLGCGTETVCEKSSYAQVIPSMHASGRMVDEVLAITNPNLSRRLRERDDLERRLEQRLMTPASGEVSTDAAGYPLAGTGGPPVAGGAVAVVGGVEADPRLLEALQSLRTFDIRDEEVSGFMTQLRKWDLLTVPERAVLVTEIESFTQREKAMKRTVEFLRSLPNTQPGWLGGAAFVAFCCTVIAGFNLLPFLASWLWGTLFVILAIAGCAKGYSHISGNYIRRWVRDIVIPRGKAADIDFNLFVGLLAGIKEAEGKVDAKLKDMAGDLEVIAVELDAYGLLTLEKDPVPEPTLHG